MKLILEARRKRLISFLQPAEEGVDGDVAVGFVDRFGERNCHRTDLHAILRVAAVGDPIVSEQAFETIVHCDAAGGMHVEEASLSDRLRADILLV